MARPWRMAESLEVLRAEINKQAPKRSTASDGGIGDAAHATRSSDHNPWIIDGSSGVVTARDFTHDPGDGFDAHKFAEWLRQRCKLGTETRVKYIISNRRIASSVNNWAWRDYSGSNPHTQHVHVSVSESKARYDRKESWGWYVEPKPVAPPMPALESKVTLTANAAKALGGGRKAGDTLSLRYIIQWGKDKL